MAFAVQSRKRSQAFYVRLAEHLGLPYLDLDPDSATVLDPAAARLLDPRAARALGALPIAFDGEQLVVAVSRPPDEELRRSIRAIVKREASFVVATPEAIEQARERLTGPARPVRLRAPDNRGREREPSPLENERAERRRFRELADRSGLEFVELEPTTGLDGRPLDPVNHAVAQTLSADLCRRLGVLPISAHRGVVTVAASDPFDELALRVVVALSGRRPRVVVAAPADLERAIERVFGPAEAAAAALAELAPERAPVEAPERPKLLGEFLLEQGMVNEVELREALQEQERSGGRIGEVLLHAGVIDERALAQALADQLRLPLLDVAAFEPDPAALELVPEPLARRYRFIPLAVREGALYLAMADPLDDDAYAALKEHTDLQVRTVVTSRSSVERLLQRLYSGRYVEVAVAELLNRNPDESAYRILTGAQKAILAVLCLLVAVLFVRDPIGTFIAFNVVSILFYAAVSVYKLKLMYDALNHSLELPVTSEEVAALDERTLPVYTILVPLYREATVVPRLAGSIARLDYPRPKLDVKLIVEEDDAETIEAIRALNLPPHFRMVVVPNAQPKTKPKACNYGLLQAEGRHVVIFDAEDRPEADQLKKVVLAFRKADPRVVCIQCKLNYFNRSQNILTRWFTSEYSNWFDLMMPGLDSTDAPIPLGGTSNHFQTDRLIELGAWDPFNVTEDADLGIRLHKAGYKTAIIDSTTYEEANSDLYNWIRQRSRWVKGYIQTWLVHMRHPLRLTRQVGLRSWLSFQLVVAGTFAGFVLNPLYWFLTSLWMLTEAELIRTMFPGFVYYAAAAGLFIGNFAFTYINVAGSMRRGYYDLVKYSLLSPLYWALMSVGAWKGLLQLFYRPYYWEKTVHGLDIGMISEATRAGARRPA
jgi:cellulose synthase/poly-beta-1,6-N-acetylglucosamine synthase-like glycosyltransferase